MSIHIYDADANELQLDEGRFVPVPAEIIRQSWDADRAEHVADWARANRIISEDDIVGVFV